MRQPCSQVAYALSIGTSAYRDRRGTWASDVGAFRPQNKKCAASLSILYNLLFPAHVKEGSDCCLTTLKVMTSVLKLGDYNTAWSKIPG
jgi:hypothetical protein